MAALEANRQEDWKLKARLAVVLWHFGELKLAAEMCSLRPDPIQRSTFIKELASWHGPLQHLSDLSAIVEPFLRSGVCSGVGSIESNRLASDEAEAWTRVFENWFQQILELLGIELDSNEYGESQRYISL